jgi:methyl-accepting chemotaxis protein
VGISELNTAQAAQHEQGGLDAANYAMLYDSLTLTTTTDPATAKAAAGDLAERRDALKAAAAASRDLLTGVGAGPAVLSSVAQIAPLVDAYARSADDVLAAQASGHGAVRTAVARLQVAQEAFDKSFDANSAQIDAFTQNTRERAAAQTSRSRWLIGIVLVFGAVTTVTIGLVIRRGINAVAMAILGPVQAAVAGDLTRPILVSGRDPLGQMGEGLNHLFTNLRASLGGVAGSAAQLTWPPHSRSVHNRSVHHAPRAAGPRW